MKAPETPLMDSAAPHRPEPSGDLRRRFHAGEPAAIDELAVAFFDDVSRFCHSLLKEREQAMEAVQETFLRLLERHRLYDPARPFRPWLFTVCRNCCLGLLRDRRTQAARVVDLDPGDAEVERLAAGQQAPDDAALLREREAEALAALGDLPEAKRSIVLLHLFEELTFREIAEITGRPANTVATTYYRTLEALRNALAPGRETGAHARNRHAS